MVEQLNVYDAPPETIVLVGEPPEAMASRRLISSEAGFPIRAAMRGTLGPEVHTSAGLRYLTAGHVAGPPGTDVQRIVTRLLRPTEYPTIGRVEQSSDATSRHPGYDVGVLDCETSTGVPHKFAHASQFQSAPLPATLFGGVSGKGYGLIVGSLAAYTDADGRHAWANSWVMTPGSIGAEGDSGASVELASGEVLGILVGGSRVEGSRNFAHLYVQDLESIARDFLIHNAGG
jgi:hypothetical protein